MSACLLTLFSEGVSEGVKKHLSANPLATTTSSGDMSVLSCHLRYEHLAILTVNLVHTVDIMCIFILFRSIFFPLNPWGLLDVVWWQTIRSPVHQLQWATVYICLLIFWHLHLYRYFTFNLFNPVPPPCQQILLFLQSSHVWLNTYINDTAPQMTKSLYLQRNQHCNIH